MGDFFIKHCGFLLFTDAEREYTRIYGSLLLKSKVFAFLWFIMLIGLMVLLKNGADAVGLYGTVYIIVLIVAAYYSFRFLFSKSGNQAYKEIKQRLKREGLSGGSGA